MRSCLNFIIFLSVLFSLTPTSLFAQSKPRRVASTFTPISVKKTAPDAAKFEGRVLELTNIERNKIGLAPLRFNPELASAARWLAQDMSEKNYFAHTDKKGRGIEPRLPDFGYTSYETIGENIAGGQPTPEAVVEAWLHSEHHRRNLFNPNYSEMGVGFVFVRGSELKSYWVQDFGHRANGSPLVIRDESNRTALRDTQIRSLKQKTQVIASQDSIELKKWDRLSVAK